MKFLEDYEMFRGTDEKNSLGQTIDEFLESYNPKKYDQPSVTVDNLIFRVPDEFKTVEENMELLMIRRKNHPSIGMWACPGGFSDMKEDLVESAKRELFEETGVSNVPLEQVHAFGNWKRDPRTRIVTVSFVSLISKDIKPKASDDAADAGMFSVSFHCVSDETVGENRIRTFKLVCEEKEKKVKLSSDVILTEKKEGILKMPSWEMKNVVGFAADHAILISDTLMYLKEKLEKENK